MSKRGYKSGPKGWKLKVEIYQGKSNKRRTFIGPPGSKPLWYWHAIAKNGRIVADSGQGYTRRNACARAWGNLVHKIIEKRPTIAGGIIYGLYGPYLWLKLSKNRTVIFY